MLTTANVSFKLPFVLLLVLFKRLKCYQLEVKIVPSISIIEILIVSGC